MSELIVGLITKQLSPYALLSDFAPRYSAKAAKFKSFLHLSCKSAQLLLFWQGFLIFLMRKTLTDNFWGLNKNMNCAFSLNLYCLMFQCYVEVSVVVYWCRISF